MTDDGRYTAKEVDKLLDDLAARIEKKINQVIVTSTNNQFPEDSNPTSLLLSVENRDVEGPINVTVPKPPKKTTSSSGTAVPSTGV